MNEKELGVVFTPPKTADYIVSKLGIIRNTQKVLDPCVGSGIFVKSLLKYGVDKSQIFCHDINSDYRADIEDLGVRFKAIDNLLSFNSECYDEYDFIVGNPPYLNKSSNYVRKNRSKLKQIYGKINAHETYSMFIVNSIWRLKEGGKLGFITSDSFLTLSTHSKLRSYILNNCVLNEILLAPINLFDEQNVSTYPVILILTKCSKEENKQVRDNNIMKIIPRIKREDDYWKPPVITEIKQKRYRSLPFNIFFIDAENQILDLFEDAPKLETFIKGYIGMHTHNNKKFIAAIEDTELANIFRKKSKKEDKSEKYKVISRTDLDSGRWKPYLKRGGGDQYYRPVMEALEWEQRSILIYDIPKSVPFEEEGIVISGVSTRLAARYMPKGCYWDSNKAMGFIVQDSSISIEYFLGLVNSSLYNYLSKGILNNTNSIQLTGIHSLPFIKPDIGTHNEICLLVKKIIENKKKNLSYDYTEEQKSIDNIIFEFYAKRFKLSNNLRKNLEENFAVYK
ncbi:MAG: N-6 DNA methylase [Candidatus Lokiarchaeota archaeon]|nr:N-6 DNA methylase [Candidatus Lokiarchaeota archaeon]